MELQQKFVIHHNDYLEVKYVELTSGILLVKRPVVFYHVEIKYVTHLRIITSSTHIYTKTTLESTLLFVQSKATNQWSYLQLFVASKFSQMATVNICNRNLLQQASNQI